VDRAGDASCDASSPGRASERAVYRALMCEGAQRLLAKQGASFSVDADPQFERDFASHWQSGALTPLRDATQAAAGAAAAALGSPAPPSPPRWAAAGE
jgi:hypothetical protein